MPDLNALLAAVARPDTDRDAPLRDLLALAVSQPDDLSDDQRRGVLDQFFSALEAGTLRAATRGDDGVWRADVLVKRAILLSFRVGRLVVVGGGPLQFSDKDTLLAAPLPLEARNVRIVPGGSSTRRGVYLGQSVTFMPPAFANVGAYIDEGTMVDSHALVGSCAQIGKRCHLSAGAQVGGVLEPVGLAPVVIEDDVFVGGNAGVYEGTVVRARAVLGAGTILTRASRVYDLVRERVLTATADQPLEIPEGAVVVPGSRPITSGFGAAHGLHVSAPMIVKYRDAKTDASTTLEDALR